MKEKRAILVGHDQAPSGAFNLLAPVLEQTGMDVKTFLDNGKPSKFQPQEVAEQASNARLVVTGMSSSAELAVNEIAACQAAVTNKVPFGFYGDTYGAHNRAAGGAWFAPFRQLASFFFTINQKEAKRAQKVFPKALCLATGNPLWEAFNFPEYSRQQVRGQLGMGSEEFFILAPNIKSPVVSILIWGTLLDALARFSKEKFTVILAYHPGDRTPYAIDPGVIEKLAQKASGSFFLDLLCNPDAQLHIYRHLMEFAPPNVSVRALDPTHKTSDVLPGANLVVEFGSSLCIEAAHLRIPVISVVSEVGANRLNSTSGSRTWEPIKLGVSKGSGANPVQLASLLRKVFFDSNFLAKLRQRQEEVYPVSPEKGTAVKEMVNFLLTL